MFPFAKDDYIMFKYVFKLFWSNYLIDLWDKIHNLIFLKHCRI